ncbi:flagellar basal body FlgE domain-containing protein [Buchnera aphidicola (Ceratoglyphina bambusae)]|uniref:flagellar basal body FlgE domain-containing protein n=1 Tax=Buchnera aphidicola TaxID=9 RepID=UPI0031B82359
MLFDPLIYNKKCSINEKKIIENKNEKVLNNTRKEFPNVCLNGTKNDIENCKKNIYKEKSKALIDEVFHSLKNRDQALNHGFFRLIDKDGNIYLTSNNNFSINNDLRIVSDDGKKFLTGNLFEENNISHDVSTPEIIDFNKKFLPVINKSNEITIDANLNVNEEIKPEQGFDPSDPYTYTKKKHVKIYDKIGHYNDLDIYFLKNSVNAWSIISINRKNKEKYNNNYIYYNRNNDTVSVIGPGIIVQSDFDKLHYNKITFKFNEITKDEGVPTYFKNVISDGAPMKSLHHYYVLPDGSIIGVFSDDTRKKIGCAKLLKLPEDVKKCFSQNSINKLNESLINFIKNAELQKKF